MGTVGCHTASALGSALATPCVLRQGAGSTSAGTVPGTALCCPLLPTSRARPLPKPPCLCSGWAPASAARPSPPVEGVPAPQEGRFGPTALLGAALPPPHCRLPASCCHSVSAKGESRYRIRACSTSSPALVLLRGGLAPLTPRSLPGQVEVAQGCPSVRRMGPGPAALPAPRSDRDQGPTLHASPASSASSPTCLVFKGVPCFISVQRSLYSLNPQVPLFVLLYNNGCGR